MTAVEHYLRVINKVKWKIANKEFTQLNMFSYAFFTFRFRMTEQFLMEEFMELVSVNGIPEVVDICNFLIQHNVYFKLKFHYMRDLDKNLNLKMKRHAKELNQQYREHLRTIKRYKFKPEIKRKLINGKERLSFKFEILNQWKHTGIMLQADSNIWWKPKKRKINSDIAIGTSYGWMFGQIILYQFKQGKLTEKWNNQSQNDDGGREIEKI